MGAIWPAQAETVPPHLAKMAASLIKELDSVIATDSNLPQAEILKKADSLLRAGYVRNWQSEPFHKATRLRQALQEMLQEKTFTLEDAQLLLTHIMQLGPQDGLKQFYVITSRHAVDEATLTERSQKIEVLINNLWKGMPTAYDLPIDKGQKIRLLWNPPKGIFSIISEDDGSKSGTPFSTRFEGKMTPVAAGEDIDFTITPAADPIRPETPLDLKRDEQVKSAALAGIWIEKGSGNIWEFSGEDMKAPTQAERKQKVASKAVLEKELQALKSQKRFVWKHSESGKEQVQEKFEKLSNDYKYVGETLPESIKIQIAALEEKIKNADIEKASIPLIEQHDPVGYAGAAAKKPLSIKVTQKSDGYQFTYDTAFSDGSTITARRVLRDKRDISDLPGDVITQLIASWGPPEWIKAKIQYQEPEGTLHMQVQWWRLNVTYDGHDHTVKSIHTPYSKDLLLTRQTEHKEVTLHFTGADGHTIQEILPFDVPLIVNAEFSTVPEEAVRAVRVSWDGSGRGLAWVVVKRSSENQKVYRSEPVILTPPATTEGGQSSDRIKL